MQIRHLVLLIMVMFPLHIVIIGLNRVPTRENVCIEQCIVGDHVGDKYI